MILDDETIAGITRDVLLLFGINAEPVANAAPADGLSSSVAIDGPEAAIVEVQMPWSVARRLADVMRDTDDASPAFVEDVAGELVNMIGGNLKGLLGGPSQLSIPSVTAEARRWSSIPAASTKQRTVGFECEVGRFFVTVTFA